MQENKFKVGDKVRYIEEDYPPLKSGEEYTVCGIMKDFGIFLTGQENWWNTWRFELVESAEEHSYSVEQVIEAFINVYSIGGEVVNVEEVIQKTKEELEKRKNPEYLKYLELKEKFEPSVLNISVRI